MRIEFRSALTRLRGMLAALAPITPLKLDDALVVLIDAALADAAVFGWLQAKAEQPEGTLSLEGEPPVALQAAMQLRGINWGTVLSSVPILIQILRDLQK